MSKGLVSGFISGRGSALQHAALKRQQEQARREAPFRTRALERQEQQDIYQTPFKKRAMQFQESQMNLQQQKNKAEFERFTEKNNFESMLRGAHKLKSITDPIDQDAFLKKRIDEIESRGGDARDTKEMLSTPYDKRPKIINDLITLGDKFGITKPEKFGSQFSAMTPEGEAAYFQAGERGSVRKLPGITPKEKKITLQEKFNQAAKLRGEISKASTEFDKVTGSYSRIKSSNPDGVGDLALIFNFMKMLDPGSVVQRGEFASAQNTAGVPERISNLYNAILKGRKLTPSQRKKFFKQSDKLYENSYKINKKTLKSYIDIGKRFGIDEKDIIVKKGQPRNINIRGEELLKEGYSLDEVDEILINEGY
ncbi:MAG: hypothetical protein GY760_29065 [Deltaproteobacteria bacterium]|nr:hypothetical protein [Deltaproteobacteria bacterium]